MKTSQSNELLAPPNALYMTGGDVKPNKVNLTSSDIDTLKLKEIEELKFERIKKKSEKQMQSVGSAMNKNQVQKSGAESQIQEDSDDYIDLKDCYSKRGLFFFFG